MCAPLVNIHILVRGQDNVHSKSAEEDGTPEHLLAHSAAITRVGADREQRVACRGPTVKDRDADVHDSVRCRLAAVRVEERHQRILHAQDGEEEETEEQVPGGQATRDGRGGTGRARQ